VIVEPGENPQHRARAAEAVRKTAGLDRLRLVLDRAEPIFGKQRVGVQEQQPIAAGDPGAGIHLQRPPTGRPQELEAGVAG
jgi:hypothetical protein